MKKILHIILLLSGFCGMAQNYILDMTFGVNGQNAAGHGTGAIELFYINNKYISVQYSQITCTNYNGTLDENFGNNGIITFNSTDTSYYIHSAKVQDDYIYICGYVTISSSSHREAFIAKISTDGVFDTTFGTNGIAVINYDEYVDNNYYSVGFSDVLLQTDGSLFLTGAIRNAASQITSIVTKITTSGLLDYTFDTQGYKQYGENDGVARKGERILNYDGGILLINSHNAIYGFGYTVSSIELIKIDYDGNYFQNFGTNGVQIIDSGDISGCKVLLNDNNLIISYIYYEGRPGNSFPSSNIKSIDMTNFSTVFTYNNLNSLADIKIDSNNKLLVADGSQAAAWYNRESDFRVVRLNMDGTLDTTFNGTGIFTYNFVFTSPYPFPAITADYASAVYVHDSGEILISGTTQHIYIYSGLAMIKIIDSALNTDNFTNTKNFTVYPNPAKNTLFIKDNFNTKIDGLVITDVMGRVVNTKNSFENVDVSSLKSGIYNLQIMSGKNQSVVKFIKE